MDAVVDRDTVLAAADEAQEIRTLDAVLQRGELSRAELTGPGNQPLHVPASVLHALARIVHELARGNAVTVMPVHAELTTQQAASLLHISRPSLIKLLDAGEMPYHYAGTHRRVHVEDVIAYKERRGRAQKAALDAMLQDAQALGIYDLTDPSHSTVSY